MDQLLTFLPAVVALGLLGVGVYFNQRGKRSIQTQSHEPMVTARKPNWVRRHPVWTALILLLVVVQVLRQFVNSSDALDLMQFVLIAAVFIGFLWFLLQQSSPSKRYGSQKHFWVGKYLVGLDNCNHVTNDVECVVAPDHFVFAKSSGQELGRIPRDSVEQVELDDKSHISQRLTATRMVALGVFALAAPKRKKIKEWCVALRWVDGKGLKRCVVFEFSGSNPEGDANRAATLMMKYILPRSQQTVGLDTAAGQSKADSRICPYCAETIKALAIVCHFCKRELSSKSASIPFSH